MLYLTLPYLTLPYLTPAFETEAIFPLCKPSRPYASSLGPRKAHPHLKSLTPLTAFSPKAALLHRQAASRRAATAGELCGVKGRPHMVKSPEGSYPTPATSITSSSDNTSCEDAWSRQGSSVDITRNDSKGNQHS